MVAEYDHDGTRRISAANSLAVLDSIAGTDSVDRGSVFIISIEAIHRRAGDRWPRKREDVWGYVTRKMDEHLSPHDVRQRVSETDFLVAMSSEDGLAAQAVGLKILEEVLVFFLGAAEHVDLKILAVSKIEDGHVVCASLDPKHLDAFRKQAATGQLRNVPANEERRRNPVSFVTAENDQVRIDFTVERIVSLRHGVLAATRITPTVRYAVSGGIIRTPQFAKLADDDINTIDYATLDYASLHVPDDGKSQSPVIVPVSFRTMGARKGRNALLTLPNVSPDRVRQGVLLELVDVDRGTPTGRLVEVVSLLSRLCRGVVLRIQPGRDAVAPVRGARVNGLTLDFTDFQIRSTQVEALLHAMAKQMRGKAPAIIAEGLVDASLLEVALAAGFTHAGLRHIPVVEDVAFEA